MSTKEQQVYESIRREIEQGRLLPGARLTESALTSGFQASRTTVRSVLRRLHADGLVTLAPNVGATVRRLSETEIQQMVELREALETYVAANVNYPLSPAEVAGLREAADKIQQSAEEGDIYSLSYWNNVFHLRFVSLLHNDALTSVYRQMNLPTLHIQRGTLLYPERLSQSPGEHYSIIRFLEMSDRSALENSVKNHIGRLRRNRRLEPTIAADASRIPASPNVSCVNPQDSPTNSR